ncbi:MAG: SCP2 sterol-binding domain-containing protein [Acidimicrobiales bacterium]
MVKYLTQEWLDRVRELFADQPERPGATVRMNWTVATGPSEGVGYYWILQNGRMLETNLGALDDAEVTLAMSYDDAVAITKLELDLNAAFMQGRVKATGNMAKLMSLLPLTNAPEYKVLTEQIRDNTEF